MRKSNAFTIVEIIIVITVFAILSSLAIVTFNSIREDSRNAARQGNATIISEALEKYYEQNGEYPSVASLVSDFSGNTGPAVAQKLSIPVSSLTMPKAPPSTTNALIAGPDINGDYIAYLGQSSDDNEKCQTDVNGSCDQYELRYQKESGETEIIESRHASRAVVETPELEVVASSATQITASWTEITGATSYTLQRSLSSSMTSPVVTNHSTRAAAVTGLSANTTYYFRVQANRPGGTSEWSEVKSAATNGVPAPTGTLTITAAMSSTNAVGTAGGGSCPAGMTIERQIRYNATATATAGSWSTYATGATRSIAAAQGWRYTFQQQARCASGGSYSGWVSSTTASVVRPIIPPAAPVVSVSADSTGVSWSWAAAACPSGTTGQYRTLRTADWNYNSGWSAAAGAASFRWSYAGQGFQYTLQAQAACSTVHTTSVWSASSNTSSYIRPIGTPGAPVSYSHSWPDASTSRWQWNPPTSPACGLGTVPRYHVKHYRKSPPNAGYWYDWGPDDPMTDSVSTGRNASGPWPTGYQTQMETRAFCLNPTTNRSGAWGPFSRSSLVTR